MSFSFVRAPSTEVSFANSSCAFVAITRRSVRSTIRTIAPPRENLPSTPAILDDLSTRDSHDHVRTEATPIDH